MSIWALIPLITCLFYIALFVMALQSTERRIIKIFAFYLAVAATWSFTSFMLHLNAFPKQAILWFELLTIALVWTVVTYYHFARAYTNRPAGIGVYLGYALLSVLAVLSLSGYIVQYAYVVDGVLYSDVGASIYFIGAISLAFIGAVIYLLVKKYRSSTDPVGRNRTAYLIVGWSILVVLSYTNLIPTLARFPLDHIGSLINAAIISYAILRFHLLDIKFVMRRSLAYSILAGTLIGIYTGVVFLGFNLFPTQPISTVIALATIVTLVLAIVASPLRYVVQESIDRLFYRGTYQYRQALLSFSSKMGNILNLNELANEMLLTINRALHITRANLLFPDADSGNFTTQFTYPKAEGELNNELRFNADNPIIAWMDKKGDPLSPEQIDSTPEFKGLWQAEKEQLTKANWGLLYPIKSRGKLIGILTLGKKRSGSIYSHEDIQLVTTIANQAGIIIENAQLYTQATIRANTDGLTGLYNHRHFHEQLEQEIARGSRFGTVFSVIMLDIDLFKVYNDIYGHLAGDRTLRKISELFKSSVRNMDMTFRYGGEEFTAILPEARLDDAYRVAERIRTTIESAMSSKGMPITVSLGVASWPSDGVSREEIIGCADTALYRAKQTGRNQTCLSSDIVKSGTSVVGKELEAQRGALNIIYALAATVDAKDHYTYGHSKKVSEYSVVISEALGLPEDRLTTIRAAALLHDIGKISIPDSILNKEGTLTEEEWEEIKTHPQVGTDILRHVIDLVNCLPAILHHHEHYDGSGYPTGLKGDKIPLEARILAVADAYDAITSIRPYHERLSSQQAITELKRCAGAQFAPEIVDVFCKIMEPILAKELKIK